MNEYKLEPCPFCGSDHVRIMYDILGKVSGVYCTHCRAFTKWADLKNYPTGHETMGQVADEWKKRWNQRGAST